MFDALDPLPSDSPGVSRDVFADDGASVSKVKRDRTQDGRPAEGLEQCVLHKKWGKGIFLLIYSHCCHHSWFSVCQLMQRQGAFGFIASLCLAGVSNVPSGAICLSSSQVLAYCRAAVRLERSQSRVDDILVAS